MRPSPSAAEIERNTVSESWCWSQEWRDVLFAHWRVPTEIIQKHVPPGLEIDLCQESAWVSAVAFNLETRRLGISLRFPELNLRTYVRRNGEPAVLFLSLHAGHRIGVALAKRFTPLPYFHARIECTRTSAARRFSFASPLLTAECRLGPEFNRPAPGSLDEWLLERYVAYTADRRRRIYRVAVAHQPWLVRGGSLQLRAAGMGAGWGLNLASEPDAWHFSDGVSAKATGFLWIATPRHDVPVSV
jgi:uncharacterized protein YqjF (DUF2071 family)